jgi:glycosyltransferase involved in cell wall biosynthesis
VIKVLMIGSYPLDGVNPTGGVEAATRNLVDGLRETKLVEVVVLDLRADFSAWTVQEFDGLRAYRGPVGKTFGRLNRSRACISEVYTTERPDIVHVQGAARYIPNYAPSVLTVHGIVENDVRHQEAGLRLAAQQFLTVRPEIKARNEAPNVISISSFTESQLTRAPGRRVWRIPNANRSLGAPALAVPEVPRFLYAGHVTRLKNVTTIVEAFARVAARFENAELVIAGAGMNSKYGYECRASAETLGVSSRIRWLGQIDSRALESLMKRSTALLLASHDENAPMVVSESLTVGLPGIAPAVGGVSEMVTDRVNGLISSGGTPLHLALAMEEMITGRRVAAMREAAASSGARYRPTIVAGQTAACYQDIVGGPF